MAVQKVGLRSALFAAGVVAAGILYFLAVSNQKNLGFVIKDADTNYYVSDWRISFDGYFGFCETAGVFVELFDCRGLVFFYIKPHFAAWVSCTTCSNA
jgi:hypothetical protein